MKIIARKINESNTWEMFTPDRSICVEHCDSSMFLKLKFLAAASEVGMSRNAADYQFVVEGDGETQHSESDVLEWASEVAKANKIKELERKLVQARQDWYNRTDEALTDEEYDQLKESLKRLKR